MDTLIISESPSELPNNTNNTNNTINTNDEICSICLLEFNNSCSNTINVSCCKNKFHEQCYHSWIINNPTCPLCRNKESTQQSRQHYMLSSQVFPINNNNHEIIIINNDNDNDNEENSIYTCRFNIRIRTCLIIIACIIGFSSLLYPIISSVFNKKV
jgi:hypothetical protein